MRSVLRGPGPESHHPETIHNDVKRSIRSLTGLGFFSAARESAGMGRKATRHTGKQRRRKLKLGFPDLDHSKALNRSAGIVAIDEFVEWYCSEPRLSFIKVVTRYRIHLEERYLAAGTQFLVGNVSVKTTNHYLGRKQRISGAVNDCIVIEP
jgi:hypothetical protein